MSLEIHPITITKAKEIVKEFHRHNKPPQGALFAISAKYKDELVGVAIIGRPVARALDNGYTVEVTRTCVTLDAPKNTNSFLYGAARRIAKEMGYKKIITYTLQKESGASLRGAGWNLVAETRKRKKGQAWVSKNRDRKWQDIYSEPKYRWESNL